MNRRTTSVARLALDPFAIAEAYVEAHPQHHLRHQADRWFAWDGKRYAEIAEGDLRAALTLIARDRAAHAASGRHTPAPLVTRAVVANALQALAALTLVPAAVEIPSWLSAESRGPMISVANGLLSIDALLRGNPRALQPHSPDWFSTVSLPYAYNPTAKAPRWMAFLDDIFGGDTTLKALVQEWFGYCLTHDTSQQKFIIFTGEGSNGKSVLLELLTRMLGVENVSHVPLELFGQRFQLIGTVGKLANVATEIGEIDRVAEGTLKAFTSADLMQFEAKGKQPISARPTARLVLSTNNLPRFADRSSGVWRRMLLVPCDVVIPPERQDPHLIEKLTEELTGILTWALEGLRRLRARGTFTTAAAAEIAKESYRIESNPARAFLLQMVQESAGAVLPCQTLYDLYRRWCDDRGLEPLSAPQFGKDVRRAFPNAARRQSREGGTRLGIYIGLAVADCTAVE